MIELGKAGWLAGCLAGRLAGWLTDWLAGNIGARNNWIKKYSRAVGLEILEPEMICGTGKEIVEVEGQ